MTLVADIIEEAFRECSLVSELQHPTPTQTARALVRLQSIVSAVYGYEMGEPLTDWPLDRINGWLWCKDYPYVNSRILLNLNAAETIYLPVNPLNGTRIKIVDVGNNLATYNVTLNANKRLIEGAATLVLATNGMNREWVYDAETANWLRIEGIELDSEMPFPIEFDGYFISMLAMALSPRYNASITGATIDQLKQAKGRMRSRYKQSRQVASELGLLRLPSERAWAWGYSWPGSFERGIPLW